MTDLPVCPTNASIVQRLDQLTALLQAPGTQAFSGPTRIQPPSCRRIEFTSHFLQRLSLWVIRSVRVHEVKPKEEWSCGILLQPSNGAIYDHIGRRKSAQIVERSTVIMDRSLAIL